MSKQRRKHKPVQLVLLILMVLLMLVSFALSFIPIANASEPEQEITTTSDGRMCAEGEVLVKFKDDVPESASANTFESLPIEPLNTANDIIVTDVPEGETVESFVETLEAQPNVEYAQPNYVYTLERTVSDEFIGSQWHLNTIGAYNAWNITMGSPDIKVAVIDTGIDLSHPDFAGQIAAQTDVVDNDASAQDDDGHGTHVAGIIAAKADNGIGVAGVAPGVKLIAVDVFAFYLNEDTSALEFGALTSEVIEGIQYAVANGADVINMSLGGSDYDEAFENTVNDAVNRGIVVVAAAGNNPSGGTADAHYPSDFESCMSVIATDIPTASGDEIKASWSNYGPKKNISAPGVSIYSTYYDVISHSSGYAYISGTSMASPVVAGVVALMLSVNPSLTVGEVKSLLYSTAVDLGTPGRDDYFGNGRVNAQAAVAAAAAAAAGTAAVEGFSLNPTSTVLAVNETLQLNPAFTPSNAANKNVSYSSNTPSVATASVSGVVTAVSQGTAVVTATTADGGFQDTCQLTVKSGLLASDVYTIDRTNNMIKGIAANTSAAQLKANLKNAPEDIKIYNALGTLFTDSKLCTGMTVKLEFGTGAHDSLTVALLGDVSGDGIISIPDYTNIRLHILGLSTLTGAKAAAADVDQNGSIDVADYTYTRLHILGLKSLY